MSGQEHFAAALLDPERPPPESLAARGFAVYRNNVVVSLIDALADRFPVIERLVGEEFFRAMARVHALASPPTSPLMAEYGEDFPDFIADFPHTVGLPYLADVARLEAAMTRAYHAADAEPIAPQAFQNIPPERLGDCRLTLHPSVAVLRSDWAIATIWLANRSAKPPSPIDPNVAEDSLVARPNLDVELHHLQSGTAVLIAALGRGATLGAAAEGAADTPGFDPTESLSQVIGMRIATAIELD